MDPKEFFESYLNDFSDLVKPDQNIVQQLIKIADLLLEIHENNKKRKAPVGHDSTHRAGGTERPPRQKCRNENKMVPSHRVSLSADGKKTTAASPGGQSTMPCEQKGVRHTIRRKY